MIFQENFHLTYGINMVQMIHKISLPQVHSDLKKREYNLITHVTRSHYTRKKY